MNVRFGRMNFRFSDPLFSSIIFILWFRDGPEPSTRAPFQQAANIQVRFGLVSTSKAFMQSFRITAVAGTLHSPSVRLGVQERAAPPLQESVRGFTSRLVFAYPTSMFGFLMVLRRMSEAWKNVPTSRIYTEATTSPWGTTLRKSSKT